MVIVRTEKRVPTTWLGRHSHVSNDTKFHAIEGQEEGKLGSTYWPRIDEASKPKDTSHEWIQRIGRDGGRKGGRNGGKIAEILSENFFVSFSLPSPRIHRQGWIRGIYRSRQCFGIWNGPRRCKRCPRVETKFETDREMIVSMKLESLSWIVF